MNPKVEFYFNRVNSWQKEIKKLRTIILDCGLNEDLKWGTPCYTLGKSNIVLIHVFKEYCAVLFFKGALLDNTNGILIQQTANVQAARQVRFASMHEIIEKESALRACIFEAIEVEKAGLKVQLKNTRDYSVPEEFQKKLDELPTLRAAFKSLTPGRQRAYILYFSDPKQSKTRLSRIGKCLPRIMDGKGLNDV